MTIPDDWHRSKRVSIGDIRRRLDGATLGERSALLDFVRKNAGRIRPTLDDDWLYDEMSSYFLDCIARPTASDSEENDDSIHSPFEAARELVDWFNWYVKRNDDVQAIGRIVDRIALVFKSGDQFVRNRIETGFLEHVFQIRGCRQHFSHWERDPILVESYTEALCWGLAHTRDDAL